MKLVALVVTLGLAALTAQSPAHATASASFSVADYTCSQFAANGILISTSTQQGPSNSMVGVPGQFVLGSPNYFAAECSASLSSGEYLTMSAHVNLEVSDQGLSGAMGGESMDVPYIHTSYFSVPSGYEFARAAVVVGPVIDYRYDYPPYYGSPGLTLEIETTQDALPDHISFSGTIEGIAYPDPNSPNFNFYPVGAFLYLQTSLFAASGIVPEPSSYAMLLAGLGLLGFAARRSKQAGFPGA